VGPQGAVALNIEGLEAVELLLDDLKSDSQIHAVSRRIQSPMGGLKYSIVHAVDEYLKMHYKRKDLEY
jgi:hypothetical protein